MSGLGSDFKILRNNAMLWFSNDATCFAVTFWPATHAAACTLDQQRQPFVKSSHNCNVKQPITHPSPQWIWVGVNSKCTVNDWCILVFLLNDAACFAVPFWPAIHAATCTLDQQRQPFVKLSHNCNVKQPITHPCPQWIWGAWIVNVQ
jgi:hypothetical protein